jgi:hypothetical protein
MKLLQFFNRAALRVQAIAARVGFLKLESGDDVLLESGDKIKIE